MILKICGVYCRNVYYQQMVHDKINEIIDTLNTMKYESKFNKSAIKINNHKNAKKKRVRD